MSDQTPSEILKTTYDKALEAINQNDMSIETKLSQEQLVWLASFTSAPERRKGVLTVLITSLVKKISNPDQDVRQHQENLPGGYSGWGLDTNVVTPFMRRVGFPSMAESGWLTRSLEQNHAYDKNYPGRITPLSLKNSFLSILDDVQKHPVIAETCLIYLFIKLEEFKRLQAISPVVKVPTEIANRLTVSTVVDCLKQHFTTRYATGVAGASRLPVLALYAVYQCLIEELARYNGKELLPLESHTSADTKSGRLGDINIVQFSTQGAKPISFEGVEVKFGIPISLNLVEVTYQKIKPSSVERYYLLSTSDVKEKDRLAIDSFIQIVKTEHGCELIVNGVIPSLKYYLRLINNIGNFLDYYTDSLQADPVIKAEHRVKWNSIIESQLQSL